MGDKAFFRISGRIYFWSGWFGCQLKSSEWKRIPAGTERDLLGETFTIWRCVRSGLKYQASWAMRLPDDLDAANTKLRGFKRKLAELI